MGDHTMHSRRKCFYPRPHNRLRGAAALAIGASFVVIVSAGVAPVAASPAHAAAHATVSKVSKVSKVGRPRVSAHRRTARPSTKLPSGVKRGDLLVSYVGVRGKPS